MIEQEFQKKYMEIMDVQAEIKKPDVYILAKCPSDGHQLMYFDTRNEDIRLLKHSIEVEGSQLYDQMRFFHGDGPAFEMEDGQQNNGRYPCSVCPANFDFGKDLIYMFSLPPLNIKNRVQKMLLSVASQNRM